jgi:hypothetical protein
LYFGYKKKKKKQITKNVTALTSVFFNGEILPKGEIQLKINNKLVLEVFSPQK